MGQGGSSFGVSRFPSMLTVKYYEVNHVWAFLTTNHALSTWKTKIPHNLVNVFNGNRKHLNINFDPPDPVNLLRKILIPLLIR